MNRAKSSPGPHRAPRLWVAFALASLTLAPSACVKKPTVSVDHAEVRSASFYGLGMEVFLLINNPNSYDVQVRNVRATVTLAGRYPVPLQFSPNRWLPADQSTKIGVPMTVPWPMVPALAAESFTSRMVPYTVRGSVDVTAIRSIGVESDDYPVDEAGTIPQSVFANAALPGLFRP